MVGKIAPKSPTIWVWSSAVSVDSGQALESNRHGGGAGQSLDRGRQAVVAVGMSGAGVSADSTSKLVVRRAVVSEPSGSVVILVLMEKSGGMRKLVVRVEVLSAPPGSVVVSTKVERRSLLEMDSEAGVVVEERDVVKLEPAEDALSPTLLVRGVVVRLSSDTESVSEVEDELAREVLFPVVMPAGEMLELLSGKELRVVVEMAEEGAAVVFQYLLVASVLVVPMLPTGTELVVPMLARLSAVLK